MMLAIGLSYIAFFLLRYIPSIPRNYIFLKTTKMTHICCRNVRKK
jgi:hypothetical protein